MQLSGVERVARMLARKPADRICVYEHFQGGTLRNWRDEGRIGPHEDPADHFSLDLAEFGPFNFETDVDRNGDTAGERLEPTVTDAAGWNGLVRQSLMSVDMRRADIEGYRSAKGAAARAGRFFCCAGPNVFELIRTLCGQEHMLIGMALDRGWIRDMVSVYADLIINLQETLFAEAGTPDGIWYYEDMGFNRRALVSPSMYTDLIQPGHQRIFAYAKSRKLPVILHTTGFVEHLIPGLIESGIDCLQMIETRAGMDLLHLFRTYGGWLSFMGGIDARILDGGAGRTASRAITRELGQKIPTVMTGYGYCAQIDRSIPDTVSYDNYRSYSDRCRKLGTYGEA